MPELLKVTLNFICLFVVPLKTILIFNIENSRANKAAYCL